jgi:hypothetical protein
MLYFIKSNKWTEANGVIQWWRSHENGYTGLIAKAGVYTEEDKARIEKRISKKDAEFVEITQELYEQGIKQLDKINTCLFTEKVNASKRYNNAIKEVDRDIQANDNCYILLNDLALRVQDKVVNKDE